MVLIWITAPPPPRKPLKMVLLRLIPTANKGKIKKLPFKDAISNFANLALEANRMWVKSALKVAVAEITAADSHLVLHQSLPVKLILRAIKRHDQGKYQSTRVMSH